MTTDSSPDETLPSTHTKPLRLPIAMVLLLVNLFWLLIAIERYLIPRDAVSEYDSVPNFAERSRDSFLDLSGVVPIVLPLLAVLIVTHVRPLLPAAKPVVLVALVEYGLAALFGLVAFVSAFFYKSTYTNSDGKTTVYYTWRSTVEDGFRRLLWLVLLGVVIAFVIKAALPLFRGAPKPDRFAAYGQGAPAYGPGAPAYGQQAHAAQQQAQYAQQQYAQQAAVHQQAAGQQQAAQYQPAQYQPAQYQAAQYQSAQQQYGGYQQGAYQQAGQAQQQAGQHHPGYGQQVSAPPAGGYQDSAPPAVSSPPAAAAQYAAPQVSAPPAPQVSASPASQHAQQPSYAWPPSPATAPPPPVERPVSGPPAETTQVAWELAQQASAPPTPAPPVPSAPPVASTRPGVPEPPASGPPATAWPAGGQFSAPPAATDDDDDAQHTQLLSAEAQERAEQARQRAARERQQGWGQQGWTQQ